MLSLFTTKSCTQCPIVLSALDAKGADYRSVDAEEHPELAAAHGFMSVPTIVSHEGEVYTGTAACLAFINEADL